MPQATHAAPEGEDAATIEQNENETLTIDDVTEVLSSPRRRATVEFLNDEGRADLSTVAEAVAASEVEGDYDRDERKRVYISLYQSHVQKLDEFGVVEFSGTDAPLEQGPTFEKTVRYLRALQEVEDDEEDGSRYGTLRDLLSTD